MKNETIKIPLLPALAQAFYLILCKVCDGKPLDANEREGIEIVRDTLKAALFNRLRG